MAKQEDPTPGMPLAQVPLPVTEMPPPPAVSVTQVQPIMSKMPSSGVISHSPKGR